jgi:malonyl-CoA/methylmalonyl-CoA synthetase
MEPVITSGRVDPIEAFLGQVERKPDATAIELLPGGRALSYRELLTLAQRYKAAFVAEGVRPGDAVLLMLGSGAEIVAALFALFSLSALAVPVNPSLTDFELEPVLRDARPVGVVSTHAILERSLLRDALCLRLRLDVVALGAHPHELPLGAPSGDPLATCHFTYKGLGYPLGALHRYSHYGVALHAMLDRYGHTAHATHLCVLPMYPVYGLTVSTILPLAMGCRLLVVQDHKEVDLLDVMRRERVQMTGFVPLLFRGLLDSVRAREVRGAALGLHPELDIISGGNHLSREHAEEGQTLLGLEPLQGYGLTETLPFTSNHRREHQRGTLGPGFRADFRLEVVNARGSAVEPGRVGEVVLSGPTVTEGYLGRPRETARFLRAGRLFTGDLGHLDRQGHLCFDGRALPFSKPAAHMVDLTEVEYVLGLHRSVLKAMATVHSDPRGGAKVSASVIVEPGAGLDPAALRRHCLAYLSVHKVPRSFELFQRDAASFARHSA